MNLRLTMFAMFLLVAITPRGAYHPSISASPNPITVHHGQTQGTTTLTWITEGSEGFVWESVDDGEETIISNAGAVEGALEFTGEVGKRYTFNLYTRDKEKLLAKVNVAVKPGLVRAMSVAVGTH